MRVSELRAMYDRIKPSSPEAGIAASEEARWRHLKQFLNAQSSESALVHYEDFLKFIGARPAGELFSDTYFRSELQSLAFFSPFKAGALTDDSYTAPASAAAVPAAPSEHSDWLHAEISSYPFSPASVPKRDVPPAAASAAAAPLVFDTEGFGWISGTPALAQTSGAAAIGTTTKGVGEKTARHRVDLDHIKYRLESLAAITREAEEQRRNESPHEISVLHFRGAPEGFKLQSVADMCVVQEKGTRYAKKQEDRFGLGIVENVGRLDVSAQAAALDCAVANTSAQLETETAGSTLVAALASDKGVVVANLGDSRAILCQKKRDGSVVVKRLSVDHKPSLKKEKARIESAKGYVSLGRLNGVLAVSRALGDAGLEGLGREADLSYASVDPDCEKAFVLIASDGVFDAFTDQTVGEAVFAQADPEKALTSIIKAVCPLSEDNKTAILLPVDKQLRFGFVADGHGGSEVSQAAQGILPGELLGALTAAKAQIQRLPLESISPARLASTLYSGGSSGEFSSDPASGADEVPPAAGAGFRP